MIILSTIDRMIFFGNILLKVLKFKSHTFQNKSQHFLYFIYLSFTLKMKKEKLKIDSKR